MFTIGPCKVFQNKMIVLGIKQSVREIKLYIPEIKQLILVLLPEQIILFPEQSFYTGRVYMTMVIKTNKSVK